MKIHIMTVLRVLSHDISVADLRGGRDGRASSRSKFLSISCSFGENLVKSYVGIPQGLAPPPRGNLGYATAFIINLQLQQNKVGIRHNVSAKDMQPRIMLPYPYLLPLGTL